MSNRLSLFRPERIFTFRDLNNIQRRLDRMFEDVFAPVSREISEMEAYTPPCDIEEADSHYVVSLDVPGMSRENLKVEISGDNLVISGHRKGERITSTAEPQISERYQGKFYRAMSFPGLNEKSKVEAVYKDGVLRIAVPKAVVEKATSIPIAEDKGGLLHKILGRTEVKKEEKAA